MHDLLATRSVAIFSDLVLNPIFSAMELEILARLSSSGAKVWTINCSGILPWCIENPGHSLMKCAMCKSVRNRGQKISSKGTHTELILDIDETRKSRLVKIAQDILASNITSRDLLSLEHSGVLIGPGISSNLSFSLRDSDILLGEHENLATNLILTSLIVVEALPELLKDASSLVVGSGRLASSWTASRVAENLGLKVFSYEYLSTNGDIELAATSPVLDLVDTLKKVQNFKDNFTNDPEVVATSIAYFHDTRYPISKESVATPAMASSNIFVNHFERGNLPSNFDLQKRNIAVMVSSEWEYSSLPGWENQIGNSQREIIQKIVESKDLHGDIHLWIRCHPNQQNKDARALAELTQLAGHNVDVILPLDPVDSYALLESCEKVLAFGSTIGVEAVFWGKPTILCGRTEYEELEVCYIPKTIDETVLLLNQHLEPMDHNRTLPYALYRQRKGLRFSVSEIKYPLLPTIRNKKIDHQWVRGLKKLRQVINKFKSLLSK